MALVAKDEPLAEITLRRYEKPYEMPRRDLIRKLCLSIGVLQPGDSRDVIVDVLQVLLDGKELGSEEIKKRVIKLREEQSLPLIGIASSNIRRQIKRLRDIHLVEKKANNYRITENEKLSVIFEQRIEKFVLPQILQRVKEYFEAVK